MVVKIYISGISGNKEVKKRQQRVVMILDSKNIGYEVVDITEPGKEAEKDFMQTKSTSSGATIGDQNPRHPLPPQIFNDETYCGDYDQFDMANEVDELEMFLKVSNGKKSEVKSQSPPKEESVVNNGTDDTNERVDHSEKKEEEEEEENETIDAQETDVITETNGESKEMNQDDEVEGDVAAA